MPAASRLLLFLLAAPAANCYDFASLIGLGSQSESSNVNSFFKPQLIYDNQGTRLPCFADADCTRGHEALLCTTDDDFISGLLHTREEEIMTAHLDRRQGSSALTRRLLKEDAPRQRARPTRAPSRQPQAVLPRFLPMPQVDSPLYEEYLKRSLWGALRSAVTREKMGICVPRHELESHIGRKNAAAAAAAASARAEAKLQAAARSATSSKLRDSVVSTMLKPIPVELSVPSLLRKSIASTEVIPQNAPQGLPLPMGNLGEFQCFSLTKVGQHTNGSFVTHSDSVAKGAPLQGSFLIQYVPLMSLKGNRADENTAFRLIAEPYEFVVPRHRLVEVIGDDPFDDFPNRVVLHRLELQKLVNAISELAALAGRFSSLDERFDSIIPYLDPGSLQLLGSSVSLLKSVGSTLYVSFPLTSK